MLDNSFNNIHSTIIPESGKNLIINIRALKYKDLFEIKSLSPLGIEIITSNISIKSEEKIDLELSLKNKKYFLYNLIIESKKIENNKLILFLKWNQIENNDKLFNCNLNYIPTGNINNPFKLNDFAYFRIIKISSSVIEFVTSLRNKFFIPALELESKINFPTLGDVKLNFKINSCSQINLDNNNYLLVKASINNLSEKNKNIIGKYIFKFGDFITLEELRKNGFKIFSTEDIISYDFVKSNEDFQEVLNLRHFTYTLEGKLPKNINIEETEDDFDKKANILIAKYKGKIIASLRLIYPDENDKLEQELYINLPSSFPPKNHIVEISRACIHPEFRKADILYNLFKHASIDIFKSKRFFLIGCCVKKLLPLYEKVGFKSINISYIHTYLANEEDNIFIGNAKKILSGLDLNPIIWNLIYSDSCKFAIENNLFKPSFKMKLNIFVYKLLKPLSEFIKKRNIKKHT